MKILVTGSSGMIGSELLPYLQEKGHEVIRLVRHAVSGPSEIEWHPEKGAIDSDALEGIEAVIHLAGENIAGGRWTKARKARIRNSRVQGTQLLCESLAKLKQPPKVLICSSAIGYYGNRGVTILDESSAAGSGFLADLCRDWEGACKAAEDAGIRVVFLRLGIVLTVRGGALGKMLPSFKMGVAGRIGDGRQYWSWIDIEDVIGAFDHALTQDSLSGPVNVVAPQTINNRQFTKALGHVLHRPTLFPMPAKAAELVLGEMADELLLASTRVKPARLLASGYQFHYPELEGSLRHLLHK